MKKYFLAISNYPDWRQSFFEEKVQPRFKEYCEQHNYQYLYYSDEIKKIRNSYTWNKPFIINDLLNNELDEGDLITSFDADVIIVDKNKEFIPKKGKSFTYAIDTSNTHNMGLYSLFNNDWTKKLFSNLIDEERYLTLSRKFSYHEKLYNYSKFWEELPHQASLYSLFGIKRHSDDSFLKMKDYGWNSNVDTWTKYKTEELHKHVEIKETKWNVTEVRGESSCIFYVNKVPYNKVIIRHFAGPQKWRDIWLEKNTLKFHTKFLNPRRLIINLIKWLLKK